MSVFSFWKPRAKKNVAFHKKDIPDEEYQLPRLSIGQFSMTDDLRRRREDEQLKKKHGVLIEKEGEFI